MNKSINRSLLSLSYLFLPLTSQYLPSPPPKKEKKLTGISRVVSGWDSDVSTP